jgi:hypothetical protein
MTKENGLMMTFYRNKFKKHIHIYGIDKLVVLLPSLMHQLRLV